MLTLPRHRDLLATAQVAAPLAGHVYARTGARVVTVHTDTGCPAARAGTTVPVEAATAADLDLTAVVAGCPMCDTSPLLARLGPLLDTLVACQHETRQVLADTDRTDPTALARLRCALDPSWAFAGRPILTDLTDHLDQLLPDEHGAGDDGRFGAVAADRWRQQLLEYAGAWIRDLARGVPELADRAHTPTALVVANVAVLLRSDVDTGLHRHEPVAVHHSDTGDAFAIFAVDDNQIAALTAATRAATSPRYGRRRQPNGTLRHAYDPWWAPIPPEHAAVISDRDVWRIALAALHTTGFTGGHGDILGDVLAAARAALAAPDDAQHDDQAQPGARRAMTRPVPGS